VKTNHRTRVVTFRVTDEEYRNLQVMCEETRKCVSELARDAVFDRTSSPLSEVKESLTRVEDKMAEVLCLLLPGADSRPAAAVNSPNTKEI
jgi:hypothetical protein